MKSHNLVAILAVLLASSAFAADVPFGPEQTIAAIDGASDVTAGDLNDDGAPDVFGLAEPSGRLRYSLNNGDGSSWAVTSLPNGSRPRQSDVGDLDGDGDLDLVYSNWNSREVLWIENDLDGTGAFLAAQRIIRSDRPDGVFIADVDGDGDLDVVVANRLSNAYYWQENLNGDASSWAPRTIGTGYTTARWSGRVISTATPTPTWWGLGADTSPLGPESGCGSRTPMALDRPGRRKRSRRAGPSGSSASRPQTSTGTATSISARRPRVCGSPGCSPAAGC